MTVREFMVSFAVQKRETVSAIAGNYYDGHGRRFVKWLGPGADLDIQSITTKEITGYRDYMAKWATPRTTLNTVKAIRAFFAGAVAAGLISSNPVLLELTRSR